MLLVAPESTTQPLVTCKAPEWKELASPADSLATEVDGVPVVEVDAAGDALAELPLNLNFHLPPLPAWLLNWLFEVLPAR